MNNLDDWTMVVGVAAVPLRNRSMVCTGVVVQADPDNAGAVFIGDINSQSVQLDAGDSESITISDPRKVYVRGSVAGQRVNVHVTDSGRRRT